MSTLLAESKIRTQLLKQGERGTATEDRLQLCIAQEEVPRVVGHTTEKGMHTHFLLCTAKNLIVFCTGKIQRRVVLSRGIMAGTRINPSKSALFTHKP